MERLDELLLQLESLPDGYISRKTIKGKVYSYLQYFSKGKIVSKYVPAAELADLEAKLAQRKAIEQELKELSAGYIQMPTLTKREKELTGNIMFGDKPVAKIYKGKVVKFDDKLAPFLIKKDKDARAFFKSRTIDTSRNNARELLRALDIKEKDEAIIPLFVNGCTLTDNYWFRPSGAVTKYENLSFGKNIYAGVAFDGEKREYPVNRSRTPEITTPGSYEKCWRFENNSWFMYKKVNESEAFANIVAPAIAREVGTRSIKYVKVDDGLKCKNFAEKTNYESLAGLVDDVNDLAAGFEAVKKFGKEVAMDYIRVRYLDALIHNEGRELYDIGVIRSRKNGQVIGMAPSFDYNRSLMAVNPELNIAPDQDPIVKQFLDFLKTSKEIRKYFKKCKIFKVKKEPLRKAIFKLDKERTDSKAIADFVFARYVYIKKNRNKK